MRVGLFLLLSLTVHLTAGHWLDWRTPVRPAGPLAAEQAQTLALPKLVWTTPPSPVEPAAELAVKPVVAPARARPELPEPPVTARAEPPAPPAEPRKREQVRPPRPAVEAASGGQLPAAQAAPRQPASGNPPVQASPPAVAPAVTEPVEVISQAPRFREPPAAPVYPAQARRRNQQGRVLVAVRLDAAGEQRELSLVQSSGFSSLDQAALAAVAGWKFQPELKAGRATPSRVQIPIDFALNTRR